MRKRDGRLSKAIALMASCSLFISLWQPGIPQAAASLGEDDWAWVSAIVGEVVGTNTSPPSPIVTQWASKAQLLGNGDMAVGVAADHRDILFYLSKNDFWGLNNENKISPMAIGHITVRRTDIAANGSATSYSTSQQVLDGTVSTSVNGGLYAGSTVKSSSWVSDEENLLVTELWVEGDYAAPFEVTTVTNGAAGLTGYTGTAGVDSGVMYTTRDTSEYAGWRSKAAQATRIIGASGVAYSTDNSSYSRAAFTLAPNTPVLLVTALRGGKGSTTHLADAKTSVNSLDATAVAALKTQHEAWWKSYWLKSAVDFHNVVLNKAYYGALYWMAVGSRPGSVAPGYWGSLVTADNPMWGGAYFQNYNYIAQTYGAFSSNRAEQAESVYQPILDWQTNGTWFAHNIDSFQPAQGGVLLGEGKDGHFPGGVDGLLYMVAIQPWGVTGSGSYEFSWSQVGNATMSAIPFMWKYQYMQDEQFLEDVAYPYMKLCADFWEDYLEDKQHGQYITYGSTNEGVWDKNPSLDLGLIRNLFRNLLEASEVLNVDSGRRAKWQDIVDNLVEQPTIEKDGKTSFNWSQYNTTIPRVGPDTQGREDRALTFLEFIFPADTLGLYSDPAQLEIARNSLDAVSALTSQHIPRTWSIAARIGYDAAAIYDSLLDYVERNLWTNLIFDGGIENVSIVESMNSMVLNSEQHVITVYPAWPADRDNEFRSLRAKGAFLVDGKFEDGLVTTLGIHSEAGRPATVHNPWPGVQMIVKLADGTVVPTTSANDNYTFATSAGEDYVLTPATAPTPPPAPGPALSYGKSYTKSMAPSSVYPDTGNSESTDGAIATNNYLDGLSYGYPIVSQGNTIAPEFTIDLGSVMQVNTAKYHSVKPAQYMADLMEVYTSIDGTAFALQGTTKVKMANWMKVQFADVNARYVKFKLTKKRNDSWDDWLFVDELEVRQETLPAPAVPPLPLSYGRPYSKSIAPSSSYPDTGGTESTDHVLASDSWGDGKSYGYALTSVGSSVSPEITVDLGDVKRINKADYHGAGGTAPFQYLADSIEVYTSVNGSDFTLQGATTSKSGNWMGVSFDTTAARYVTFKLNKTRSGSTDDWLFVDELQVWYTTNPTGSLLSRGSGYAKSVAPSASYPDTGNTESTNGMLNDTYAYNIPTPDGSISPEITLDLGSVRTVGKGKAYFPPQAAFHYEADSMEVYTSVDGGSYTLQGSSSTSVAGWMEVSFANTYARFVKFKLNKTRSDPVSDWLFVGELEVWR